MGRLARVVELWRKSERTHRSNRRKSATREWRAFRYGIRLRGEVEAATRRIEQEYGPGGSVDAIGVCGDGIRDGATAGAVHAAVPADLCGWERGEGARGDGAVKHWGAVGRCEMYGFVRELCDKYWGCTQSWRVWQITGPPYSGDSDLLERDFVDLGLNGALQQALCKKKKRHKSP